MMPKGYPKGRTYYFCTPPLEAEVVYGTTTVSEQTLARFCRELALRVPSFRRV